VRPLARPPADLAGFPAIILPARRVLYRIHRGDRLPWWFSSDGSGRFDLPEPRGSCYLTEEPLGAFVEVFRDTMIVSQLVVEARRLSRPRVARRVRVADCTSRRARSFGVTAGIHSSPEYRVTQAWASAFTAYGFDGIRYLVSHDPAQRCVGIALFGRSGAVRGRAASTVAIPEDLIRTAADEFGILVVPAV